MINILNFSHILGLAIWLGSMVTWAMFAPKLSTIDPTKNTTNTLREIFTKLSWSSYGLALISGIGILILSEESSSNWSLSLGLLVLAGLIIFLHSYVPNLSSAIKGMINGAMLLLGLIVLYLSISYI
jgi:putative copper export protein